MVSAVGAQGRENYTCREPTEASQRKQLLKYAFKECYSPACILLQLTTK